MAQENMYIIFDSQPSTLSNLFFYLCFYMAFYAPKCMSNKGPKVSQLCRGPDLTLSYVGARSNHIQALGHVVIVLDYFSPKYIS